MKKYQKKQLWLLSATANDSCAKYERSPRIIERTLLDITSPLDSSGSR